MSLINMIQKMGPTISDESTIVKMKNFPWKQWLDEYHSGNLSQDLESRFRFSLTDYWYHYSNSYTKNV